MTSCKLWTLFQRVETHRCCTGREERITCTDTGIRETMHRMLAHQSRKETKKGKKKNRGEAEKAVTSKSKHDEQ